MRAVGVGVRREKMGKMKRKNEIKGEQKNERKNEKK